MSVPTVTTRDLNRLGACEGAIKTVREHWPDALAEYERVEEPAWAEYDRVVADAWAECDRVRADALAEYEGVRADALATLLRAALAGGES